MYVSVSVYIYIYMYMYMYMHMYVYIYIYTINMCVSICPRCHGHCAVTRHTVVQSASAHAFTTVTGGVALCLGGQLVPWHTQLLLSHLSSSTRASFPGHDAS